MHEHDERTDRYLVSYADMVTLLVGVFVVLSTTFRADAERYRRVAQTAAQVFGTATPNTETLHHQTPIERALARLSPSDIQHDSTTYRCILADEVLFESGSSRLEATAERALAELAQILRNGAATITIDGHSDSRLPRDGRTNIELSVERALAVAKILADRGVPESRLMVRGFGATRPLVPDSTSPKNRRVEILIAFDH